MKATEKKAKAVKQPKPKRIKPMMDPKEQTESQIFGQRVREIRRRQNLTQFEVARRMEVAPSFICQIESGNYKRYNISTLKKLCFILNVSMDYLAFGKELEVDNIVHTINMLPDKDKRVLIKVLQVQIPDEKAYDVM